MSVQDFNTSYTSLDHELIEKSTSFLKKTNLLKSTSPKPKISKNFKNVQILWASVREPYNYIQAKQLGCHIITIPPSIIEKIQKFGKSFDQLTQETVKNFLIDSRKSKFKL